MKRKHVKSAAITLAAILTACSMTACGSSSSKFSKIGRAHV